MSTRNTGSLRFTKETKMSARRTVVRVVLVVVAIVHLTLAFSRTVPPQTTTTNATPPPTLESKSPDTLVYRYPLEDGVDCGLVFKQLARLYHESKLRRAAWEAEGYNMTVLTGTGNKNVSEIRIVMMGDSWAHRNNWGVMRFIDLCRLRHPLPLLERDECTLHAVKPVGQPHGQAVYQISMAVLGLSGGVPPEQAGILRIQIHFDPEWHMISTARAFEGAVRNPWPTPSFVSNSFPRDAQCRDSVSVQVEHMAHQMPLCLCKDTENVEGEVRRRVPVDVFQLSSTMWDTVGSKKEFDLISVTDVKTDWYLQLERFAPDLTRYPYMTFEQYLGRFSQYMVGSYVNVIRETIQKASVPPGVPMPRVLLSTIPLFNCTSWKIPKHSHVGTTERCEAILWPVHTVTHNAVLAAYGEARMGLPAVHVPEWFRLVDYRSIVATGRRYGGESIAPGQYRCEMSDGAHLDTRVIDPHKEPPHTLWCTVRAHSLFWESLW